MLNTAFPVVAVLTSKDGMQQQIRSYTKEGKYIACLDYSELDLVECTPWDDFKMFDPVMVRNHDDCTWYPRFFAGVVNGRPHTWAGEASAGWNQCRHFTSAEVEAKHRYIIELKATNI